MSCCWCLQLYVSLLLTLYLVSGACSSWVSKLRPQFRQREDIFHGISKAKCLTLQPQFLWVCCRWMVGGCHHLVVGTWHPVFREGLVSGTALATEVQLCVCVSARA